MKKEILQENVTEVAILKYKRGIITQGNTDLTLSELLEKLLDKSIKSVDCLGNSVFKGYKGLRLNEYDNCYYLGNEENPYIVLLMAKSTDIPSCEINSNTKVICAYAFYGCSSLTSIVIPASVTGIGEYAFGGCYNLVEIYNLSSLYIVKDKPSNGCVGSFAIVIHTSLEEKSSFITKDNYSFVKDDENKYYLVNYTGTKSDIVLPNDIDGYHYEIYNYAFFDCTNLTSITIPRSVTGIGQRVFSGCSSLTNIEIPSGVKTIGFGAFEGCSSLTSIEIPSSVKTIGYGAFSGCSSLTNVLIPNNVKSIGEFAFMECTSLTGITIPSGVKSIREFAFMECTSLTGITILSGVKSIGYGAFSKCSSLKSIEIPSSVKSIGYGVFSDCSSLEEVYYKGTPNEWNRIDIHHITYKELTSAIINYYTETKPIEDGNYWHYVEGIPTKW